MASYLASMFREEKQPLTNVKFPTVHYKADPDHTMLASEWHGNKDIRLAEKPRPLVTDPRDVVVRTTATTVCGSDLHLYHNEMSGLQKGDIIGHEAIGIIHEVGDEVKNLKVGDRVVISFDIACGDCEFCNQEKYTLCVNTNPTPLMDSLYGARTSGAFGYTSLLGGYEGCQAEYIRVPIADINCLKIPEELPDETAILLADIAGTGWHANELGEVKEGDTVAVWGCGPVGLMAIMWAKFRGASKVIAIDNIPYRLNVAESIGAEVIDFSKVNVVNTIFEKLPLGADVCIEAVGFRYAKSLLHKAERMAHLETDTADILSECIKACKKGGRVSIIGDYYAFTNHFPIGALMEKSLTVRGGQSFTQKYWKQLMNYFLEKKVDPTFVISHVLPFDRLADVYSTFDKKEDNMLKVVLKPTRHMERR